jgi:hypothetical protein
MFYACYNEPYGFYCFFFFSSSNSQFLYNILILKVCQTKFPPSIYFIEKIMAFLWIYISFNFYGFFAFVHTVHVHILLSTRAIILPVQSGKSVFIRLCPSIEIICFAIRLRNEKLWRELPVQY